MFSGLVHSVGRVVSAVQGAKSRTLTIACSLDPRDRVLGASIAVSGVCLTVTETTDDGFAAQVAFESLRKTKLGDLRAGAQVNLEPALRLGDALGGHLVTGHVDGIGEISRVSAQGEAREYWVRAPTELLPFIAPKGSICIDGVSLTVNEVVEDTFMIGLVPHTLAATTLGSLGAAGTVHLEIDVIARYVVRWLSASQAKSSGLDMNTLIRTGMI
jgi:riboflavin synthase